MGMTGYLIGATNQLLCEHPKMIPDILINLDKEKIEFKNEKLFK